MERGWGGGGGLNFKRVDLTQKKNITPSHPSLRPPAILCTKKKAQGGRQWVPARDSAMTRRESASHFELERPPRSHQHIDWDGQNQSWYRNQEHLPWEIAVQSTERARLLRYLYITQTTRAIIIKDLKVTQFEYTPALELMLRLTERGRMRSQGPSESRNSPALEITAPRSA